MSRAPHQAGCPRLIPSSSAPSKGEGKVYLHAVVDTYRSYAFGFLHVPKQPESAMPVLHNNVLALYRRLDLPVRRS